MSKTKSVSDTQIVEMKKMVVDGVQPQRIAEHFHIGISTVHNYKKAFKNEGLEFKSVRGRTSAGEMHKNAFASRNAIVNTNHIQSPAAGEVNAGQPGATNTFVVNGTSVNINSNAKSVNINRSPSGAIVFEITL